MAKRTRKSVVISFAGEITTPLSTAAAVRTPDGRRCSNPFNHCSTDLKFEPDSAINQCHPGYLVVSLIGKPVAGSGSTVE